MKIQLPLFITLLSFKYSQSQDRSNYKNIDTLSFYAYSLEAFGGNWFYSFRSSSDTCKITSKPSESTAPIFFANCNEITKEQFDSLKKTKKNFRKCKPCVLNHINDSGVTVLKAVQFQDCYIGDYLEYYENGQLKIKGKYKKNYTGKWRKIWKGRPCAIKEGEWVYYDKTGKESKREFYKNNILVK